MNSIILAKRGHDSNGQLDLVLPLDAVTHKIAILGMSGSGKTYCAGKLTEELLGAGAQVVIIDTVGNWYGLRLAADGKKPGIAIPVFGGNHGDVPLEPAAGELVAELVAKQRVSVVLDVSDFTEGEKRRFVTAFARRLLAEKKQAPGPMMVLWEECHECIPQRVDAADAPMVGAVERLVKRGRNYGIGTTLVSQQPQAVNKAVLNQAQLLLAFQTSGKHERKAIEEWVDANRAEPGPLDALATLQQGQAVVWSPAWLRTLKIVHIAKKSTYDASATPDFDNKSFKPGALAKVDLDAIRVAMADVVARVEADDPKKLRQRIAELEAVVHKAKTQNVSEKIVEKVAEAVSPHMLKQLERLAAQVERASTKAAETGTALVNAAAETTKALHETRDVLRKPKAYGGYLDQARRLAQQAQQPSAPLTPRPAKRAPNGEQNGLSRAARALLEALWQRDNLTRPQLATLSGYSISSSSFANAISELHTPMPPFILKQGDLIALAEAGHALVSRDGPLPPRTKEELRALWRGKLTTAARTLFNTLCRWSDEAPDSHYAYSRVDLSRVSGYSLTSSSFANAISELNTNGLILKSGSDIQLVGELR